MITRVNSRIFTKSPYIYDFRDFSEIGDTNNGYDHEKLKKKHIKGDFVNIKEFTVVDHCGFPSKMENSGSKQKF